MAEDDLAGYLKNARDTVVGAVKTGADVLGRVVGGPIQVAPMSGRLPLGKIPTEMPVTMVGDSKVRKVR